MFAAGAVAVKRPRADLVPGASVIRKRQRVERRVSPAGYGDGGRERGGRGMGTGYGSRDQPVDVVLQQVLGEGVMPVGREQVAELADQLVGDLLRAGL